MRVFRLAFVYLPLLESSANVIPSSSLRPPPVFGANKYHHLTPSTTIQKDGSKSITSNVPNQIPQARHTLFPILHKTSLGLGEGNWRFTQVYNTPIQTQISDGGQGKKRKPRYSVDPEPTPSPSPVLKNNSMCVFLGAALGICNSLTPGFTTMSPSMQAQCLCYSSAAWSPNVFDDAANQCAAYASTAAPKAYKPLVNLEGFCESIGDVKAPKSTDVTTTHSPVETPTISNPDCDLVSKALGSCIEKNAAFGDLDVTGKAKCLCYDSNTSWRPTQFDNAVKTCAEEAYYRSMLPSVGPLASLCGAMGDVLSSTLAGSATADPKSMGPSGSTIPAPTLIDSAPSDSMSINPTLSKSKSSDPKPASLSNTIIPSSGLPISLKTGSTPATSSNSQPQTGTSPQASQTSAPIITPTTALITRTPTPTPINSTPKQKNMKAWQVIWVSFLCAFVVIFLC